MNKTKLCQAVAAALRENNIKKHVHVPKTTFKLIDPDGTSRNLDLRPSDRDVNFTQDDVEYFIDALIYTIKEALKRGETIQIQGVGSIGLKLYKGRNINDVITGEIKYVEPKWKVKPLVGKELRRCAEYFEEHYEGVEPEYADEAGDDAEDFGDLSDLDIGEV